MDNKQLSVLVKILYANHTVQERLYAIVERCDLWPVYESFVKNYSLVDQFMLAPTVQGIIRHCDAYSFSHVCSELMAIGLENIEEQFSKFIRHMENAHMEFSELAIESNIITSNL